LPPAQGRRRFRGEADSHRARCRIRPARPGDLTVRLRPRSLRARLTLWYTGALGGLLVLLGTVAVLLLDHGLRGTEDASLESLARTIVQSSRAPTRGGLADALEALLGPAGAERFYQLLDPLGRPDPRLVPPTHLTLPLGADTLRNAAR